MRKGLVTLFITVFGTIGGYIPIWLFHAGGLSGWSFLAGGIGSLFGIWVAVKVGEYIDG